MRNLVVVFMLFCFFNSVFAKQVDNNKVDTTKVASWIELGRKYDNPLFLLDGTIVNVSSDSQLTNLDPKNVFTIDIVEDKSSPAISREKQRTAINILSKGYAIKQYQNKLSAFSREYESYLKTHNNKDDDIQYVVHSDPLEKQEVLNFLYKLPPEKIIGVTFTERPGPNGTGTQKTVIIETKVGE